MNYNLSNTVKHESAINSLNLNGFGWAVVLSEIAPSPLYRLNMCLS
jgi:hypothetical protein